jgi:voltage-gated potassium channel
MESLNANQGNLLVQVHVSRRTVLARKLDRYLARPMFFLTLGFLVLLSGVIHRVGTGPGQPTELEEQLILWGLLIFWPIFFVEGLLRFYVRAGQETFGQRLLALLLQCLAPLARLAARSYEDPRKVWLPRLGWKPVDRHLRRVLERFFSIPMIIIALMILPFLALEYVWAEQVRAHFGLGLLVDIGNSIIWMAFAIEFIIMVSMADKKVRYCFQNWMDLAIVLIPLLDFLPMLRLLRLSRALELQQLTRVGRVYRLRGLLMKLWRSVLVLEMIHRLFGNAKVKRLRRLRELLAAREEEIADLRREIVDLENQLAEQSNSVLREPAVDGFLPSGQVNSYPADPSAGSTRGPRGPSRASS